MSTPKRVALDKRSGLVLLSLILGLTWIVTQSALTGPFLFDDQPNLQNLAIARGAEHWIDIARYVYAFNGLFHRAISALAFLIDAQDWPSNPYPFKRTNLLLHLACGVAVYALSMQLTVLLVEKTSRRVSIALLTSAAWLLNPIQLSTTMLVVQRMTILMSLFSAIGLALYVRAITREHISQLHRAILMLLGLWGFGALAVLSKENGALITLYAVALDLTVLRQSVEKLNIKVRMLHRFVIWIPIACLVAYISLGWPSISQGYQIRSFTLSQRLLTESRICFDYLGLIFLPRLSGTGLFHDDYSISRSLFDPLSTIFCVLGWSVLIVGGFFLRKRFALFSLAILWFVAGMLMESTIIPLELYFEHRNYLPMVGPLFAIAAICCAERVRLARAMPILLLSWISLGALITFAASKYWGDERLLSLVWANENPGSVRAQQLLGEWYYTHGHFEKALEVMDRGVALIGPDVGLLVNSVFIRCELNTLTDEDLDALGKALRQGPLSWGAGNGLKTLGLEVKDKKCDGQLNYQRWKLLVQAAIDNPVYQVSPQMLGQLHYEYAVEAQAMDDLSVAIDQIELSNTANPDIDTQRYEAFMLYQAGRYEEALKQLDRADPKKQPLGRRLMINDLAINDELRHSIDAARALGSGK